MTSSTDESRREVKLGAEFSLQPGSTVPIKFNLLYKGKKTSFDIYPNEVKVVEVKRFVLIARYVVNGSEDKVKWAALDKYGKLIGEGEI